MVKPSAFFLSLLVTVVFMFALRPFARSVGLIDKPGGRKTHKGDIPVIGGLAMLGGLLIGSLQSTVAIVQLVYLLASCCILVFVGAVDDRYDLPPSVRFLAQACAVVLMIFGAEFVVKDLGQMLGVSMDLGWFAPVFTLLLVLTAINAFNMFDGSDGVAGIQALIALAFLGFAAIVTGNTSALPLILTLAGAVLGFLLFNWPSERTRHVRAFMGDAGSTMLGFALAWVSIDLSQGASRAISPVVVLWIFALPVFDLFSNMLRRVRAELSPFHADSEHLHHILKRYGLNSRRVAQVILSCSALLAGIGVGAHLLGVDDGVLLTCWLLALATYYFVFGSNLVIKRRAEPRNDQVDSDTGTFEIWRQRR